jgi:hypothetical protein
MAALLGRLLECAEPGTLSPLTFLDTRYGSTGVRLSFPQARLPQVLAIAECCTHIHDVFLRNCYDGCLFVFHAVYCLYFR